MYHVKHLFPETDRLQIYKYFVICIQISRQEWRPVVGNTYIHTAIFMYFLRHAYVNPTQGTHTRGFFAFMYLTKQQFSALIWP